MRRIVITTVAALAIAGGVGTVAVYAQSTPIPSLPTPNLELPSEVPDTELPVPGDQVLPDTGTTPATPDGHHCTGHIKRVLEGLVENDTITQAQADAVLQGTNSRIGQQRPTPDVMQAALEATLKDLVSKRTITQAQSNAITQAVAARRASRDSSAGFTARAPQPGVFTV